MAPFLPVRAISRSQAVRIGGQTIKTNATTYVDLGNLAPVLALPVLDVTDITGETSQQHAGTVSGALKASVYWGYAVTAVDASGAETPINGVVSGKTGAGGGTDKNQNFVKVTWTAVPNATSYNVYRVGKSATGITTAALSVTGQPYFLANTTGVTYLDTGVEVTTKKPPVANDTSIYTKRAFSPKKELRNHLALGAVVIAGPLTASGYDWVVPNIPSTVQFVQTFGAKEVRIAEGQILQRSTGILVTVTAATLTSKTAAGGKEYNSYVVFNTQSHLAELVEGTEVATGKAVLPTLTSVQVPLYTINTAASETPTAVLDLRPRQ